MSEDSMCHVAVGDIFNSVAFQTIAASNGAWSKARGHYINRRSDWFIDRIEARRVARCVRDDVRARP